SASSKDQGAERPNTLLATSPLPVKTERPNTLPRCQDTEIPSTFLLANPNSLTVIRKTLYRCNSKSLKKTCPSDLLGITALSNAEIIDACASPLPVKTKRPRDRETS
ncbi:5059_t:CDS:2, partial [Acaulospora morrowiae]